MTSSFSFWKNKKVLITGHTGFKGSWLSLWLHQRGAKLTGLSLPPITQPSLFDAIQTSPKSSFIIDSRWVDIRDPETVTEALTSVRPEVVIHMAAQALVRPSYEDPIGTYATNVMGTVHLLNATRQCESVRAFVNVTSDKCYENREWPWGYRETDPMGGHDPYSSSKGCAELVTSAFWRSYFRSTNRMGLASARAGNVIGGGDWSTDRLIPDCVRAIQQGRPIPIRNPRSVRPWQHVLEPLNGYLLLAEKLYNEPHAYSQGWNFAPDLSQIQPVRTIADQITSLWQAGAKWEDASDPSSPHEAHLLSLDSTLARSRLDWTPRLSLTECLSWVVEWYRRFNAGEDASSLVLEQIARYEAIPPGNQSF